MLILSPEEAKPGMMLAALVAHPDSPEQDLLKRGYVLEATVLKRLGAIGVTAIYVAYPALDDLDRHLAVYLSPARQAIYRQIKQTISSAQQNTQAKVSYKDYYDSTRDLITTLLEQGQNAIYLDQMSRLGGDSVGHATAVAHLSLLLGIRLENYLISERKRMPTSKAKDVVNLGIAGMLHDLGKTKLPVELQTANGVEEPADEESRSQWRGHAHLGYEMIHNTVEPTAAAAVLHHHQHFDGSGFPSTIHQDGSGTRMEGNKIHIFARIIQAADLYDRLKSAGNGRRRTNFEILELMRTKYVGRTDPIILQTLQSIAPPFPPGSRLGLSDGSTAIVIDVPQDRPYHPLVRRLGKDNWTLVGDKIDLRSGNAPTIRSVAGEPLQKLSVMKSPALQPA